ncbi:MAG: phosphoribosyltransferase family protein [Balneolaceae bacterium]
MNQDHRIVLMDRARIERTLRRMAFQIAERAGEREILLIGLNERGSAVAAVLEGCLKKALMQRVKRISWVVTKKPDVSPDLPASGKKERMVIWVDDVIFTGSTMFSALQKIAPEPEWYSAVAVLIDRGHRQVPVHAEFSGIVLQTKAKEHVEVTLRNGEPDEVLLIRNTRL